MKYFDYSATTYVDEDVLKSFLSNINDNDIDLSNEKSKIQTILNTDMDIIYTSGSTESNNIAIKGIAFKYFNSHKHIITTKLEHSSISEQMFYLEKNGFVIDYVNLIDGVVDIDHLKSLICDDTILVSIASVDSETGVLQPIDEIGKLLRNYPNVIFHSDMTQSIGKVKIDLSNVDMVSFSAHKFYGLKGIGCLLKRSNIDLVPLVYGNRNYNRALIKSLSVALDKAYMDFDKKYEYVLELNNYLRNKLHAFSNIIINSNTFSIPHILNISVSNFKPEVFQHSLEFYDIYISTKSACSNKNDYSKSVFALTNDIKRASTSVRISISYLTKLDDINYLIDSIKKVSENND